MRAGSSRRTKPSLVVRGSVLAWCVASIAGCSHGESRKHELPAIQATVSRLSGTGLVLQVNGTGDVAVQENGSVVLARLPSGSAYAVTVKAQPASPAQICTVAAGEGTVGSADVSDVAVTCRSWNGGATLDGWPSESIALATNPSGNAVAVWSEPRHGLSAAYFTPATGWGAPQSLQAGAEASNPRVAIDPAGDAIAVWERYLGDPFTTAEAWVNRYAAGSGWGTPGRLDDAFDRTHEPDVAMDAAGGAIAVWARYDTMLFSSTAWSKRWVPGSGWGQALRVDANGDDQSYRPRVATDAAGNAILVWSQTPTTSQEPGRQPGVWSRRYDTGGSGGGWGDAHLVDPLDIDRNCEDLQVAMNARGDAVVAWAEVNPGAGGVCARTYAAGAGWDAAEVLGGDEGRADRPAAAIDARGDALVVWVQQDDTGAHVWSRRHVPASGATPGWGDARSAGLDGNVAEIAPRLASDASGNAVAVWLQQEQAQRDVWFNVFSAGTGWATSQRLCPASAERDLPAVAMSSAGDAMALWVETQAIRTGAFK